MSSYQLSGAAERDLAHIAAYTVEAFGVAQALAYRDGLIRSFDFLAENPNSARLRHELNPPVRAHRFQSHLIFYDVQADGGILILRVRHGREDWLSDMD
ncbi:type II toxin-antitoxin system RelE/ParE family toxin [Sphingobium cupriresistens]|uniref:Toxin n=1 Tax=Sphingobium cupriresistens TaxID=1132417 RepID=A0A8G1ZKP8_9SPHN|nr:type II toxin-antitoxin system RelE/ParE family toxin [Sphingobium cupriresistens]RYM09534.1 type II toxin-antitoxin system RelE/ParE family toxin [Sphingobium cupriresistens]